MEAQNIFMISLVGIVAIVAIFVLAMNTSSSQVQLSRAVSQELGIGGDGNIQPLYRPCMVSCIEIRDNCNDGIDCRDSEGNSIDCDCGGIVCECLEWCYGVDLGCSASAAS